MAGKRLALAAVAAAASALTVAIVLAVVDLYLSGHGLRALGDRPLVDAGAVGVHLSLADGILLAAVGLAVLAASRLGRVR